MDLSKFWIYDIETFKDCFSLSLIRADNKHKRTFVCSRWHNDIDKILNFLDFCNREKPNGLFMVGFNNVGFDYPVLHDMLQIRNKLPKTGIGIANKMNQLANKQIASFRDGEFGRTVKNQDAHANQLDLYRIWHFNNKAKATSLKMLEFNMRMQNISDLPFAVDESLSKEDVDRIIAYNEHDVFATLQFFLASQSQVAFRLDLNQKLGKDFTNADDTKIGAEVFVVKLEEAGIKLHKFQDGKRKILQTHRDRINVKECLFDYYSFTRKEFQAVYDWFSKQVITETKGVFSDILEHDLGDVAKYAELTTKRKKFKSKPTDDELSVFYEEYPLGWIEEEELKATEYAFDSDGNHILVYQLDDDGNPDLTKKMKKKRIPKKSYYGCYKIATTLNVVVDGFRFDFGTGGIHGSLSNKVVRSTKSWRCVDLDVSSFYPNLAISNNVYPEHLTEKFCEIYKGIYEQRKTYAKNTPENAMLKLSLNGTYGKSNDKFSVFYDPKFTMTITIGGQLTLCLLIDMFYSNGINFKMVMANTDGVTFCVHEEHLDKLMNVVSDWENKVKLEMERVDYEKMYIRDVNNYTAISTNGKVKRKGAYQYEGLAWHQNHSALVIPMAAEAFMLSNKPIGDFIKEHLDKGNIFDFMLRTKVDRSSRLITVDGNGNEKEEQRICRYYVSNEGGKLVKIMKPLEGSIEDRRFDIESNWLVKTCNNMKDFDGDINFDYYVQEARKLVIQ